MQHYFTINHPNRDTFFWILARTSLSDRARDPFRTEDHHGNLFARTKEQDGSFHPQSIMMPMGSQGDILPEINPYRPPVPILMGIARLLVRLENDSSPRKTTVSCYSFHRYGCKFPRKCSSPRKTAVSGHSFHRYGSKHDPLKHPSTAKWDTLPHVYGEQTFFILACKRLTFFDFAVCNKLIIFIPACERLTPCFSESDTAIVDNRSFTRKSLGTG